MRLITTVDRAGERIKHKTVSQANTVLHFIRSLSEQEEVIKRITLHQHEKVIVINLDDVVCIRSIKSYCEVITATARKLTSAKTLSEYELILEQVSNFVRATKNLIINVDHVIHYTKGSNCFITMNGMDDTIEVSRRRKTAVIAALHHKEIKNR